MIHIISIHANGASDKQEDGIKFLHLQLMYLKLFTQEPFKVYIGIRENLKEEVLDRLSKFTWSKDLYEIFTFDILQSDQPPIRLNYLYDKVLENQKSFDEDDLIVFMDCDAWGLWEWDKEVRRLLISNDAVSVERRENPEPLMGEEDKPYPHPCFFATKANFWKQNYDNGLKWGWNQNSNSIDLNNWLPALKHWFKRHNKKYHPLIRTNCMNLHPLNFGVYGDIVYHHGAGTRIKYDSVDIWIRKGLNPDIDLDLRYPIIPMINQQISEFVLKVIESNPIFINIYFMGKKINIPNFDSHVKKTFNL